MAGDALHDLTPAYALDALDAEERAAYEEHLATCERCREELETMQRTASSLAYAVRSPAPPPELRERILDEARIERGNVVPFRGRRLTYALGAAATVAAAVAVVVGLWATSLSNDLDRERSVIAILTDGNASSYAMDDGSGRVIVTESGEAAFVAGGLAEAPEGKTYVVWVIEGRRPMNAGSFDASGSEVALRLTRPVPNGALVAVTVESDGDVEAPTSDPITSRQT